MLKTKQLITAMVVLFTSILSAQITSSSVSGKVRNNEMTVVGASVTLTHLPTNQVYKTKSLKNGSFGLDNLTVGGPYKIEVAASGYKNYANENIILSLGDNDLATIQIEKNDSQLAEVVVTSAKKRPAAVGIVSSFSEKTINSNPNMTRSIPDVTKLVPQSSNNSFAGTNFRYNNVTVDGSINNDAIGFSPSLGGQGGTSGMPGSSTRSNSISLDAIQDVQVYIAPYDVKLGNFLGGSVNAVTRSGTNKISGSVYSYGRNAGITGSNNVGDGSKMPASFEDYQVGFRLGLPIIKDKLFFFTNMEYAKRNDPVFYNAGALDATGKVASLVDNATATSISNFVKTNYGFDIGSYNSFTNHAESRKYFNKIDWKINDKHNLAIRNNIVLSEASNLERDGSTFRFASMDFVQKNQAISTVLELKSHFTDKLSNSFVAGYSTIKDFREPQSVNNMFPTVEIGYNGGTILFGNDREATVFNMKQNTIEITDNLTYKTGNHTLLFGTHNEFYTIDYGFVSALNGRVAYKSLSDFYAGLPSRVRGSYSFYGLSRDDVFNNPYAKFNVNLYSAYVQDEIKIGTKLKITPGIRIDYADVPKKPSISNQAQNAINDPNYGTSYNYTPINQINNNIFGSALISPRLGFQYNVYDDKSLIVRGGTGVFTGRIPFAWLGYAFYNDGVGFGSYDRNNLTPAQIATLGNPLNAGGLTNYQGQATPKTQLDLIDNNFKMPQILRNSLAVDYLFKGYKFTVEGIYTKVIRDLKFQQINKTDNPVYFSYDTNHEMPVYNTNINSSLSNAYLLSNTDEGYRYSVTGQISKTYDFGFNFMAAYTYGSSKDISNGIRNSMESNWQLNQSLTPNDPKLATSNFDVKHRVISTLGYSVKLNDKNTLSTNVFFSAQSGNPFTWGFVNSTIANSGQAAGLAYIFKDAAEAARYIGVNTSGVPSATAAQQVADYENFINNNEYLSSRRGNFTERNGDRTPWNIQADFRIMDEIRIKSKDNVHTLQFSLSIINVGNMINKDWGKSYFVPNTFNSTSSVGLTRTGNLGGVYSGDPVYTFQTPTTTPYTIDQFASRWQGQFGVRYSF